MRYGRARHEETLMQITPDVLREETRGSLGMLAGALYLALLVAAWGVCFCVVWQVAHA